MKNLKNLKKAILKYGIGPVVTFATLDGYRRAYLNDLRQEELRQDQLEDKKGIENLLEHLQIERKKTMELNDQIIKLLNKSDPNYDEKMDDDIKNTLEIKNEEDGEAFSDFFKNLISTKSDELKSVEEKEVQSEITKEITSIINMESVSPEFKEILEGYRKCFLIDLEKDIAIREHSLHNNEITKSKMDELEVKSKSCMNELIELKKDIYKSDISGIFIEAYNQYAKYLDSLTPDKIVCLFNIIVSGITLLSFSSVLSIMLSDNIINRIKFLDKYPIFLKLLRLRNIINRKVAKFHLFMHIIWILAGLLGNIYMFFL